MNNPEPKIPKKRGRKPNKMVHENEEREEKTTDASNPNETQAPVILRLAFNPTINKTKKNDTISSITSIASITPITSTTPVVEKNHTQQKNTTEATIEPKQSCTECVKKNSIIDALQQKIEKMENNKKIENSNKLYVNNVEMISIDDNKKVTIEKTNLRCWWDTHTFDTLPCFLPELYVNNTYHIIGCFCSFNCALAYNLYYIKDSRFSHRKALTYKLYREISNTSFENDFTIKEAPQKEILVEYGGPITIEKFRADFNNLEKDYIAYMPPVKSNSLCFEERFPPKKFDENNDDYRIKRNKPLFKNKSIINTMIHSGLA